MPQDLMLKEEKGWSLVTARAGGPVVQKEGRRTCQTTLEHVTEAQTMLVRWWKGSHIDRDDLDGDYPWSFV